MPVTRINNNQITDSSAGNIYLGVNAAAKVQDYSVTGGKLQNNLTYGSDFTITGNLTVQGNTTTIDTVNLVVEDPLILLAKEQTGSPTLDIGYIGKRGTSDNIAFVWDESQDEFVTVFTDSETTNTTINITAYASLRSLNIAANGNVTVAGTSDFNGNVTLGNIQFDSGANVNIGNNRIQNVAEPSAGSDAATKDYVDGVASSGFTIEDDAANTTQVSGGDTLELLGTANQVSVLITGNDQVTFALTSNVSVAGNVTGGNLLTGGVISATGNATAANMLTGGAVSATGNVTGGNIFTAGQVSATGNITANYFIGNGSQLTGIDATQIQNGTSNVSIPVANGNVEISVGSSVDMIVINSAGGDVTGYWSVTGNVTGGNVLTGGVVSATGTITGGNLATAGTASATGNVTGGNLVTAGQVTATGNLSGNNISAGGFVSAVGNVIAPTIVTTTVTTASGDLVLNSAGGALQWDGTGNIVMNSQWINNLADPTQAYDAATKQYVDDAVSSGITVHTPVYLETPTALPAATYAQGGTTATVTDTVAGNTVVFSAAISPQVNDQYWFTNSFSGIVANTAYFVVSAPNTSAAVLSTTYDGAPVSNISNATGLTQAVRVNSGIGATLTGNTNASLTVDGVAVTVNDRILVYNQTPAYENGVYVVTQTGNISAPYILTRSTDTDVYGPKSTTELDVGDYFYVQAGNTGAGESYVMTAPTGPFIIGYDSLTFTQFSASQVYSANTSAGLALNGTVFSAKIDNDTTAFDGGGNIVVKAGANLVTPNIGAATGTSLSLTGNVTSGNVTTGGVVSAGGNVIGANLNTAGAVSATGNVDSGNVNTAIVSASGNITGSNLLTGGAVSATGNVTGGNVTTAGQVTATGNVTGGNINTSGLISVTGNVISGNLTTGIISATGNINGTGAVFSGNVTAANFIGNISGNIDAAGANTQVQFNNDDLLGASANFTFDTFTNIMSVTGTIQGTTVSATGNVIGGNVTTAGLVSAGGNVTGANFDTAGLVTATGNVTAGNVITGGYVTATGNVTAANLILTSGTVDGPAAGIIAVNGTGLDTDFSVSGDTVANILYIDAGTGTTSFGNSGAITNAIASFNTTDSILLPRGNTAQRPAPATVGMLRFNTTSDALEIYNSGTGWTTVEQDFTVIVADSFTGNGVQTIFTLSEDSTTAGTIVSINGVVQIPTTAYSVSGNALTFTEAPSVSDTIDARILTTSTSVTSISNASGNATVSVLDNADTVQIEGNLLPSANVTYDLGSNTLSWRNGYFSGNTIFLGNLQLKQADASTFAVYTSDGITQANIDVGSVDVSSIISGTTVIGIGAPNGNAYLAPAGSNALVAASTGVFVTGVMSATGNVIGGNVTTAGLVSATGNVNGGNLIAATVVQGTTVSATGDVNGANLNLSGDIFDTGAITIHSGSNGNITLNPNGTGLIVANKDIRNGQANGVGNIGTTTGYFNTIFAKATSAQYADLAEMYEADGVIEPGTVVAFGGAREVTTCDESGSRRVAGVVSTNPSYIMNAGLGGDNVVAVALTGRVPTRVTGTVRKGDLMIAAGGGRARAEANPAVGAVIGKALADFDGAEGTIEVVVGRL